VSYLIDTDWIVDVLHGQQPETQTLLDLAQLGLAVSIITYGELYEGAYYARNREQALVGVRAFLMAKDVLPLTLPIMERFAIIRGSLSRSVRQQIGDMDLLIAATALEHELTLVTHNLRDFEQIPDLKLYQPN